MSPFSRCRMDMSRSTSDNPAVPERKHACLNLVRVSTLLALLVSASAPGDTVSLIDGRVLEGKITLDTKSGFVLVPKNQPSRRIELKDVLTLSLDARKVKPPTRMVRLVNGGQLAADEVLSLSDREIRVKRTDATIATFSSVVVSSIDFRPADEKAPPPESFVGVQSVRGDLAEGEITRIENNQVSLSSVLFGIQTFDVNAAVRRVQLRATGVSKAVYVVQTVDGSVYHAQTLRIERGKAVIGTEFVGDIEVSGESIRTIELGPGAADPLAQLTTTDADGSLTLKPGEARDIKLDGKYSAIILTVQVPSQFVPTRAVQFVVELDGKEIAKTSPLTALDPPQLMTLPVESGQVLRIKVSADGPAQLGTAARITSSRAIRKG